MTAKGKLDRDWLASLKASLAEEDRGFVAPRDLIELNLKLIWEEVLNVRPISTIEDFVELGGDSLLAARVNEQIRDQFKQELPLSTLFQERTIKDLAKVLRQMDTPSPTSPIVKLQAGGARRPFFCVHPSGGNVLCYVDLARYLGADQAFFGLQDPPRLTAAENTMEASRKWRGVYVESVRATQPSGPYLLGGYSFGGVVAYEMSQQLVRQGEQVALLAVLESQAPLNTRLILDLEERMGMTDELMLALNIRKYAGAMEATSQLFSPI